MDKMKMTGRLQTYLKWPLVAVGVWALLDFILFLSVSNTAGVIGLIGLIFYLGFAVYLMSRSNSQLMNEMVSFATNYGQIQKQLLQEFPLPYAILDAGGNFLWMNDEFAAATGKNQHYNKNISSLFADVKKDELPLGEEKAEFKISANDKQYSAILKRVPIEDFMGKIDLLDEEETEYLISISLFDETELNHLQEEREDEKIVCGLLTLDNYDEVLENVEDVRKSLLLALIERKINQYFNQVDGIVKKQGHDRYFFMLRKKALLKLEENKFSLIEDVKNVNIGNEMSMTMSIGVGLDADSYQQNSEAARVAMELALGRGGDQVVIKDGYRTRFYGGKTESAEKMTRVKARVKAQAMKEILEGKSRVVIMGHKISDIDSIGAAIGIYRAAKSIGKAAHIVGDDVADSVKPVISMFEQNKDYEEYMFVDRKRAKDLTNADTALVIVDTNRANYTACPELLKLTNTVIVFDHHRQGVDRIQNAVLSYIEPYASSACEMVAEVLQYFDEATKLKNIEADAMYAGIVVDTSSFITRTGVRTFEAAAFLRRSGADITRVRKMFREHPEDLKAKAKAIADAELFMGQYAVSVCPSDETAQPTVVAAQAANELLNVENVKASFVLTEYNDLIYISARAIDEVNVQIIMERMGGGGHLNIAGCQLPDYTMEEALDFLRNTIEEMDEEGDL